jgi:hypothetical protein
LWRLDAAWLSVSISGSCPKVSPLMQAGYVSCPRIRQAVRGRCVVAERPGAVLVRIVRVRPEVKAPAYAGCFRMERIAATVGRFHTTSPKRSRRGRRRPCALKNSSPVRAARRCRHVVKTNMRRAWTARLASVRTGPWASRASPVGKGNARSPRAA